MDKAMVRYVMSFKWPSVSRTNGNILLVFIAIISIFAWCGSSPYAGERISVSGITEPIKDVTLSLTVPGMIEKIYFKEGDHIEEGQTILALDDQLETFEVARRKVIWESKAELESAQARLCTAKSLLESTRQLFESTQSVSGEELEEKELEYKLALAEEKRLEIEEERQRIEYEMSLENLRRRRLVSPIGGVIIKLFLEEGETCEAEQPLVHIVDTDRCRLVCNVEESLGRCLRKGQTVELSIRTGSKSIREKGTIAFVSPVVDPASSLLEVKAEFDNDDGKVRPGIVGYMLLRAP